MSDSFEETVKKVEMISDKERRHVAKRLRGIETIEFDDGEMMDFCEVVDELWLKSEDGAWVDAESVRRLADLINRPTTTRHGKFRTKYGRETPCCEVCGYSIGDMRWGYCPKCGAVITDD